MHAIVVVFLQGKPDGRTFSSHLSSLIPPKQIPFGVFEIILFIDSSKITPASFLPSFRISPTCGPLTLVARLIDV
jgi:hypothetical protein